MSVFRGLTTKDFFRRLGRRFLDNALTDRAAQLAYYFMFSLFPFLFFIVTLTAYLPLQGARDELLARLGQIMPDQAFKLIQEHLDDLLNHPRPKLLTVGLVTALWSASRGVDALRGSLNLSYDVKESRHWLRCQGQALLLTVVGSALVLVSIAAVALGGRGGELLADKVGLGQQWHTAWIWLRWPIAACVICLVAALLYYVLPDVEQEFRYITPGSVAGTALWLAFTWLFTQYAEHFSSYNATYGSIGGVIVLMTWLYITGLVFIVGGEVNALLEQADPYDGKAKGARHKGEKPPPVQERPSAVAPGAVKTKTAADHSNERLH